jgi:serine protease
MKGKRDNLPECGEGRGQFVNRVPLANVARHDAAPQYSGFIIVRLSARLPLVEVEDLREVAQKLGLDHLRRILEEYDLRSMRVVRSRPPEEIIRLEREAAQSELPPLHSLTQYWRLDARARFDEAEELIKRLMSLPEVDLAYLEGLATDPTVNAADDPYSDDQGYLDAAPTGIDARWAWTQPNGVGAGVAIVDLEQGWFPNHEDLVDKTPTIVFGDNLDGVGTYKGNHGTAVLGEMVGVDNTVGVVGIAPAVTSVRMASHYNAGLGTNGHVADAIVGVIPLMAPGDLLLLEVQKSFLPTETDDADFDAIRLAVAHGIIVVEAAGNGNANLDTYTNSMGERILNRTHADFRESGAIMIGACESDLPHDRWPFSNFGSRIDCYGWGENVVTCGYGDLAAGTGDNETYTNSFQGTSSASPIVTGAALILQSMYEATTGTRLSPGQMRAILSNPVTGTPQGAGTPGNIGVMPNLQAIITTTLGLVPDVYLRDNVGDTGVVPSSGSISASPDVIVRPSPVADPTASFGQGSGTENSNTLGFEVEAGQDNSIYVRMKNRGAAAANNVTADVYWSPVATLLTPDLWTFIGSTAPVNVPVGNTLVVAGPITWDKDDIPALGHYCFMALLDHPQDAAPPLPPGPPHFDWDAFRAFVRNHNNVTWRNFNVVDDIPDPSEPAEFAFLIVGAPDRERAFDFELIQDLPQGAEVLLVLPPGLAARIVKGLRWPMEVNREGLAVIRLPRKPRLPICGVRLPRGAKLEARLIVRTTKEMQRGGHAIAIRQIYDGEEVGRITWQFHRRRRGEREGIGQPPGR